VPVRATGLGSRRLTGLAIQHEGLGLDSILLIDEIEYGLEPHRIRRLIKRLCEDRLQRPNPKDEPVAKGQVLTTTHSPTPIMSLDVRSLRFVRCEDGVTTVTQVEVAQRSALQPIARTHAHAFLARKIVVCEGKTEEAMLRGLDDHWEKQHDGSSFATCGVVGVNGGGRNSGPTLAVEFRRLGYDVAFLGDSDEPLSVSLEDMAKQGISAWSWPGNVATEERICLDLPLNAVQKLLDIAIERYTEATIRESLKEQLGTTVPKGGVNLENLIAGGVSEDKLRSAVGKAAKSKGGEWFKDITTGELLGGVVASFLAEVPSTPLSTTLAALEEWVYAE
jgi:putative ATP-dependent endonuclease of OLD family